MKLREIAAQAELKTLTPELGAELDAVVTSAHTSDLLSDILATAPQGSLAVTIQAHLNTVAVAVNARLAGIVFASGREPDPEVVTRAREERVPLFTTPLTSFDVSGRLYALGLRGAER